MSAGTHCRGECVRMSTGRVSQAGVADSCRVLLVESRQGQFVTRVEVVVAEDEHAFARAAGEVELQFGRVLARRRDGRRRPGR